MTVETPNAPPADWTPVALSRDLPVGTSAGVVLGGAEIVLWRDTAGALHAWEDRCPHRGMKLSFGFVRGDRIACLYHGWEYGHDAVCKYIPAHPDLQVPASIRVARHSVAEGSGMIWVAGQEPPAPPPLRLTTVSPLRSMFMNAGLDTVIHLLSSEGLPGAGPITDTRHTGAQHISALLSFRQSGLTFHAGLHSEHAGRTALHLVAEGVVAPETCAALIPFTAALRRKAQDRAENEGAA